MKDDSWGRGGGEEDGDHGGGGIEEEAGAKPSTECPDVMNSEMGEEESGLDFGDGFDLWLGVSSCTTRENDKRKAWCC